MALGSRLITSAEFTGVASSYGISSQDGVDKSSVTDAAELLGLINSDVAPGNVDVTTSGTTTTITTHLTGTVPYTVWTKGFDPAKDFYVSSYAIDIPSEFASAIYANSGEHITAEFTSRGVGQWDNIDVNNGSDDVLPQIRAIADEDGNFQDLTVTFKTSSATIKYVVKFSELTKSSYTPAG